MTENDFKVRTKDIALRIFKLVDSLPRSTIPNIVGRQLVRSGTSIGANYRAACRARSTADLISKLSIVEEETDESLYWIDLLVAGDYVVEAKIARLRNDIDQILAMTVASIKTLKAKNNPKSKIENLKSEIERPK